MSIDWDLICRAHKEVLQLWNLKGIPQIGYGLRERKADKPDAEPEMYLVDDECLDAIAQYSDGDFTGKATARNFVNRHRKCGLLLGNDAGGIIYDFFPYKKLGYTKFDITEDTPAGEPA